MKCVPYQVNGTAVNQSILSSIQDFTANMVETHDVSTFNVTGNVGIGTASPDEKLTVYGKIHSQEVKVDLSVLGPDYVFEPDYQLKSLPELKAYVDKNHHLPEIPSATEMAKDGINLGDMNTKLLKKIEELTLYLIEKDKQIEDLQSKKNINQTQQSQIDELREQVETLIKKKS